MARPGPYDNGKGNGKGSKGNGKGGDQGGVQVGLWNDLIGNDDPACEYFALRARGKLFQ